MSLTTFLRGTFANPSLDAEAWIERISERFERAMAADTLALGPPGRGVYRAFLLRPNGQTETLDLPREDDPEDQIAALDEVVHRARGAVAVVTVASGLRRNGPLPGEAPTETLAVVIERSWRPEGVEMRSWDVGRDASWRRQLGARETHRLQRWPMRLLGRADNDDRAGGRPR